MLGEFLVHFLISAMLVLYIANQTRGIRVASFWSAIKASLLLGAFNALLLRISWGLLADTSFLVFIITLFITHTLMLRYAPVFLQGFSVTNFVPAIYGSILMTMMDILISFFL